MPPQMFTRNCYEVPILTRVSDQFNSYMHASHLFSIFDITFALSNYTISYDYLQEVGFWDTCYDAVAEDYRMIQKAFWKNAGRMRTKPIYVPFAQLNIKTGNGYCADVKAKYKQS